MGEGGVESGGGWERAGSRVEGGWERAGSRVEGGGACNTCTRAHPRVWQHMCTHAHARARPDHAASPPPTPPPTRTRTPRAWAQVRPACRARGGAGAAHCRGQVRGVAELAGAGGQRGVGQVRRVCLYSVRGGGGVGGGGQSGRAAEAGCAPTAPPPPSPPQPTHTPTLRSRQHAAAVGPPSRARTEHDRALTGESAWAHGRTPPGAPLAASAIGPRPLLLPPLPLPPLPLPLLIRLPPHLNTHNPRAPPTRSCLGARLP